MAQRMEVNIPDIGGFNEVPVIEISVQPGDRVKAEDTLLILESDKATMEIPAPVAGVVKEVLIKVGDKVAEGTRVVIIETEESAASIALPPKAETAAPLAHPSAPTSAAPAAPIPATEAVLSTAGRVDPLDFRPSPLESMPPPVVHIPSPAEVVTDMEGSDHVPHASPSIRALARELGVSLAQVTGNGSKGRITREDVHAYVKLALSGAAGGAVQAGAVSTVSSGGLNLLPWPKVDFSKFGAVEAQPLSRIKKLSGANLARNWAMIPHVTQFDEADIGALEALRVTLNKEHEKAGVKLTMLAFLIKASVAALQKFPEFNASLDGQGDEMRLVLKKYFHIGFAADTPNGLVVPVIRDADRKGLLEIATEMAVLSKKARDGKLMPTDMQGGCFSISSLGGIGGTAFTPIINAPEVAILGVSKSEMKPKWDVVSGQFQPRLMLPLSLSYDHRVIDGAAAARFTAYLGQLLADLRRVLL